ncbi:hypothetical protein HMPREF9062_0319, partial [Actinomyces sp. oral taxon 448 str. F0400]
SAPPPLPPGRSHHGSARMPQPCWINTPLNQHSAWFRATGRARPGLRLRPGHPDARSRRREPHIQ